MAVRKGFDISPILNREFNKATTEYIKGVAPERLNEDPEAIPELLIHTVKRIHRVPTASMLLAATQATQLPAKQIIEVWDAMWEKA